MDKDKLAKCFLSVALIYSGLAVGVTEALLAPIWFEFVARLGSKPPIRRLILMSFYWSTKFSNNIFGRIYLRLHRNPIAPILFLLITSSIVVINQATLFQFGALAIITTTAYGGFYATGTLWLLDLQAQQAPPYLQLQNLMWFLGRNLPKIIFQENKNLENNSPPQNCIICTLSENYLQNNYTNSKAIEDLVYPNKKDFYLIENHHLFFAILISIAFLAHFLTSIHFVFKTKKKKLNYEEFSISNFPVFRFVLGVLTVSPTINWTKNGPNLLLKYAISTKTFLKSEENFLKTITICSFSVGTFCGLILSRRFQAEWMLIGNVAFVILGSFVFFLGSFWELRILIWIGVVLFGFGISSCTPNALAYVMNNFEMTPFVGATFFSFSGVSAHGLNIVQSYFIREHPSVFIYANFLTSFVCVLCLYLFMCKSQVFNKI